MKNYEYNSSTTGPHTLPYLYGWQNAVGAMPADQRPALYVNNPEPEPDLEELKANDPDSYRMVVYSWG
jgi:hypothetical protein